MFFWALSSSVAARLVVPLGFRTTARARRRSSSSWASPPSSPARASMPRCPGSARACALVGCGLGFAGLTQVLAIQHTTPESIRGVATSLVPFFRAVGGSLGVGALGGLLSLRPRQPARSGRGYGGTAGWPTARRRRRPLRKTAASLDPTAFRHALERSLLPVFVVLLALAVAEPVRGRLLSGPGRRARQLSPSSTGSGRPRRRGPGTPLPRPGGSSPRTSRGRARCQPTTVAQSATLNTSASWVVSTASRAPVF